MIKASDFIVKYFELLGIKCIFGYQGGMVTHLVDSLRKSVSVKFIQCYHEQSAAFCAEGYAKESGMLGVAIATSGPGATNLITGIADAYFDSVPVLFITGQVNSYEYKYEKKKRQQGFQETDVVSIVKPITKYAEFVDDVKKLPRCLKQAAEIAMSGRKGPVLLDISMDVQRSEILWDENFFKKQNNGSKNDVCFTEKINSALEEFSKAKSPLVLCGQGIKLSHCEEKLEYFVRLNDLPCVVSLLGKGCIDEMLENFVGMIGSYGNRAANIIFENADCVLVLGSRLDLRQTGNVNSMSLQKIRFIHIDIDENELNETSVKKHLGICCDLNKFFDTVKNWKMQNENSDWKNFVVKIKNEYSQQKDISLFAADKMPYISIQNICACSDSDTVFVSDIGQNQMWAAQMLCLKKGQEFFTGGGLAAMGCAVAFGVGIAFANPKKKVICIVGDGGFEFSLQSLLLISQYDLNVMVVVLNNESLGMITQFQSLYFDSNMAGTTKNGGYIVGDIKEFAQANYLCYEKIKDVENEKIIFKKRFVMEINLNGLTTVVPKLEYNKSLSDMTPKVKTYRFLPNCTSND
ncbi:MAG: thiamine pyrophosphate-binding protein [Bacteroides sp.]|nr:thiamine pyrophosphate-binding protein [Prevotella sp.]MCM1408558.1 thiamine pyrophosphate-binding protein [Treponema brennaborense]MCM1470728.1 thiamine pyrophosphate-binding protein [Bacteroides sp.]